MIGLILLILFCAFFIYLAISDAMGGKKTKYSKGTSVRKTKRKNENRRIGFGYDSNKSNNLHRSSDPYDNHWESSFDWKDEDNDGYDDRDDGFWNEKEF